MRYHPDLAAALAEARVADLHDAAARARHDSSGRGVPPLPSSGSMQLDAYPRLCGLPVTIERLANHAETSQVAAVGVTAGDAPAQRIARPIRRGKRARRRPAALSRRRAGNDDSSPQPARERSPASIVK
jgi:hypothetical protein